jgi:hypothetical protein
MNNHEIYAYTLNGECFPAALYKTDPNDKDLATAYKQFLRYRLQERKVYFVLYGIGARALMVIGDSPWRSLKSNPELLKLLSYLDSLIQDPEVK